MPPVYQLPELNSLSCDALTPGVTTGVLMETSTCRHSKPGSKLSRALTGSANTTPAPPDARYWLPPTQMLPPVT